MAFTVALGLMLFTPEPLYGLTANKISFEFHPGFYRVIVRYTLPALKEYREAYADFKKKKEAEAFYWGIVRGADFFYGDPRSIQYVPNPKKPDPW